MLIRASSAINCVILHFKFDVCIYLISQIVQEKVPYLTLLPVGRNNVNSNEIMSVRQTRVIWTLMTTPERVYESLWKHKCVFVILILCYCQYK